MIDAVPFSPSAHLTAAITATQTYLSCTTTTNLPDPSPIGRCTIRDAYGHEETVDYTGKTETAITGMTRGVEGTPYAFGADATIARVPTAEDWNGINTNIRYSHAQLPIGVRWNRLADDTTEVSLVDLDGNAIPSLPFSSWDKHAIYREIRRCVLSAAGAPTWGTNGRGDGLVVDGTQGMVATSLGRVYIKAVGTDDGNEFTFYISPRPEIGFKLFPSFRMRTANEHATIFVGAYPATLATRDHPNHADTTLVLHSQSGQQPVTGYTSAPADCYVALPFTSGGTGEPVIGETLTGASSNVTARIVDWVVTGGTWAGGDAAGTLYLKQTSGSFTDSEQVNGSETGHTNLLTAGTQAIVHLTVGDARGYAEAIGTGWGLMNVYTLALLRLLMLIECGSFNIPGVLGRGVCDLAESTGFAGRENGYGSADTVIGTNGTGAALGAAGTTPVVWRGIEGLWGNVKQFVDGIESTNTEYRIIKRDGTGTFANPIGSGDYEVGTTIAGATAAPTVLTGYASQLLWGLVLRYLWIAAAVAGSAVTYIGDKHTGHTTGATGILIAGGAWYSGDEAGPFTNDFSHPATYEAKDVGCRLEWIGEY